MTSKKNNCKISTSLSQFLTGHDYRGVGDNRRVAIGEKMWIVAAARHADAEAEMWNLKKIRARIIERRSSSEQTNDREAQKAKNGRAFALIDTND